MKNMVNWIKATSDIMVRVLLGQEENLPLLKDFINAVLLDRGFSALDSLTIENPINMRSVFYDKETFLDVKAKDSAGRIYDVEIQSIGSREFIQRSLYYWAKLYSAQLKTGHEYKKLNPVICINLLDFTLFPDKKEGQFHSCHMITDLDDPETVLTDHLRIHYLELPRIKVDPSRIPADRLNKWAYFFKEEGILEEDEMKILIKDDPIFEQAHETFNKFTADDELREIYEGRMKFKRDQAQFMSDAREEGREESIHGIATALKKDGISIDTIQKATGLSREEIEKL
ncbi:MULTISPECIES: Rpn family recombination-promoting nuclease/putative transposase [unclassified Oceanispirochaeta]|uniref:Rpn family recombination-promoting nuclease/putative transposase n=1 Tax=unclassified Oceanispirochaeta TaxID=2635722 RepID=UPI000E0956CA|nr:MULTISPECIES: Rpn family recombination-promoting nuclease/putative transposase [unclassified Oceanispirochaeta]MBF9015972.1 PD-(D/E)XK nuclease family transposase [Oceanispirochaeta sp. M2]NPD72435.1 PD-(D/E)XK nuclease family transposase [Oceanispirochaeta sp. M1]RDG32202.1 Rpn family recombination-promoting nuclease/putative transposase [Oceanispirochaeta sp. M1]